MLSRSKILVIAGSDSSGGAGIQADIKTITSLGSYPMTAVTAAMAMMAVSQLLQSLGEKVKACMPEGDSLPLVGLNIALVGFGSE